MTQTQHPTQQQQPFAKLPQLRTVDPEQVGQYLRLLLIGPNGAGKTLLAGSAATDERIRGVLHVDMERRTRSIAHIVSRFPHKIRVVQPTDLRAGLREYIKYMQMATNPALRFEEGTFLPDTIVLDSVTHLADVLINDITGNTAVIDRGELPGAARIQDWGILKSYIEGVIRQLTALPCHVIVTCRESSKEEDSGRKGGYKPLLPGQLSINLPSLFNEVWWMDIGRPKVRGGEAVRTLLCKPDGEKYAKTSIQGMPASFENPTFTHLYTYHLNQTPKE